MSIFVKGVVVACGVMMWDGPSVSTKGSLFTCHAEGACIHRGGYTGVIGVVVVSVTHVHSVRFAREEASRVGIGMVCDNSFEDGMGEEMSGWVR